MSKSNTELSLGFMVGSEIGDINREIKILMGKYIDGDVEAFKQMMKLTRKKEELLKPKSMQKRISQE